MQHAISIRHPLRLTLWNQEFLIWHLRILCACVSSLRLSHILAIKRCKRGKRGDGLMKCTQCCEFIFSVILRAWAAPSGSSWPPDHWVCLLVCVAQKSLQPALMLPSRSPCCQGMEWDLSWWPLSRMCSRYILQWWRWNHHCLFYILKHMVYYSYIKRVEVFNTNINTKVLFSCLTFHFFKPLYMLMIWTSKKWQILKLTSFVLISRQEMSQ